MRHHIPKTPHIKRNHPITLVLAGGLMTVLLAGCGSSGITVTEGTYGGNCQVRAGNATADLAKKCDGQKQCDYAIDVSNIGDPAVGCAKDFLAVWRCGSDTTLHRATVPPEAGLGKTVRLSCS